MAKDLLTRVSQRALIYEVSRMLGELAELDKLIPFAVAKTTELMAVESTAVLLLDTKKKQLYFPYVADRNYEAGRRINQVRFAANLGISGWVVQHGEAVVVPDVHKDPRWYPDVDRVSGMHTRSLLCAPLRTPNGTIGVISARNKLRGVFTDEDLAFMTTLAGAVAVAIENAMLRERLSETQGKR